MGPSRTDLAIYCKAWPVRNGTRFLKTVFALDWEYRRICCPNQYEMPFEPGETVHFPAEVCAACSMRERVAVEHTLAHLGYWQGRRARSRGDRKNLFDLRRCAIVHHLHVLARLEAFAHAAIHTKDSSLSAQYQRFVVRRGGKKATIAVGHTLLVMIYHLLSQDKDYEEFGGNYFDEWGPTSRPEAAGASLREAGLPGEVRARRLASMSTQRQ
jgi:hypothetical protein